MFFSLKRFGLLFCMFFSLMQFGMWFQVLLQEIEVIYHRACSGSGLERASYRGVGLCPMCK